MPLDENDVDGRLIVTRAAPQAGGSGGSSGDEIRVRFRRVAQGLYEAVRVEDVEGHVLYEGDDLGDDVEGHRGRRLVIEPEDDTEGHVSSAAYAAWSAEGAAFRTAPNKRRRTLFRIMFDDHRGRSQA
jgi:hypothetical protein